MREWLREVAPEYKKKAKLDRAITRVDLRYQDALDNNGCRKEASRAEVNEIDADIRKLPESNADKIDKFYRIVVRLHNSYLLDCKQSRRLKEVSDRLHHQFTNHFARIGKSVKSTKSSLF